MFRRQFLKGSALTAGALAANGLSAQSSSAPELDPLKFPPVDEFARLAHKDGLWCLRLALRAKTDIAAEVLATAATFEGPGEVAKRRTHRFQTSFDPRSTEDDPIRFTPEERHLHVLVLWIEDPAPETAVRKPCSGPAACACQPPRAG